METKTLQTFGRDGKLLETIVPNLRSYTSRSGAEGVAYFVGKEFVVKYFERVGLEFSTFDNYCNEIQSFADGGLACPKIYSWATSPICAEDNVYRFYILQEQVPGEELLPNSIRDIEPRCLTFCSKREFVEATENIAKNKVLYAKLLDEFASVVFERNKQLASLSKEEIERFMHSYFEINRNSVFSSPDLHPGNVLFDGKTMTIIDEVMACRQPNKWLDYQGNFKEHQFKVQSFYDLLYLFSSNRYVQVYIDRFEQETGQRVDRSVLRKAEETQKVFGQFMQSWVGSGMKLMIPEKLTDLDIDLLYGQIGDLMDEKSAKRVLTELQR